METNKKNRFYVRFFYDDELGYYSSTHQKSIIVFNKKRDAIDFYNELIDKYDKLWKRKERVYNKVYRVELLRGANRKELKVIDYYDWY